jgi:hypothetical protein
MMMVFASFTGLIFLLNFFYLQAIFYSDITMDELKDRVELGPDAILFFIIFTSVDESATPPLFFLNKLEVVRARNSCHT